MSREREAWSERLRKISWREIVWWGDRDLCRLGIDTINLLCALGLPGTERMDIAFCLRKIDEWDRGDTPAGKS